MHPVPENAHNKPNLEGLWVHCITTTDRIKKYSDTSDKQEIKRGGASRIINLLAI